MVYKLLRSTAFLLAFMIISLGTADAQWHWQNPLPQGNTLNCVSFSDADNGLAVGENGVIIRTTDGGATWVNQAIWFNHQS